MAVGELRGQIAAVTGGSGAIGSAICSALRDGGAKAYSLDVAAAENDFIHCDVRDEESIASALQGIREAHPRLDILVHAAGISREGVVWKLPTEDWDAIQAVNLRAGFLLMKHGIPHMRVAGSGGRIVLIGSINGSRGKFGTSAYSASKAGLVALAKSSARELGRFGILVNVVEPGWVRTPLTEKLPQKILDAAQAESLIGSFLDPDDVANAVRFLAGPGARRITGQILRVDGGQFLGPN